MIEYTQKKEVLQRILKTLSGHRDMAEGFLVLVNSSYVTPESVDQVITMVYDAMKTAQHSVGKQDFDKAMNMMEDIKHKEKREEEQNERDVEQLLDDITTL